MFKKLKILILKFLNEGLSPQRISIAVTLGISMGIFPIYGPITLICLGLCWLLKLNTPMVIAGCYSMTFVKPLLILPFLKLGEVVFRAEPMPISLTELSQKFAAQPLATLQEFAWSFVHAIVGWMAILPILTPILYFVVLGIVLKWKARKEVALEVAST